jgi:hypothetical protein
MIYNYEPGTYTIHCCECKFYYHKYNYVHCCKCIMFKETIGDTHCCKCKTNYFKNQILPYSKYNSSYCELIRKYNTIHCCKCKVSSPFHKCNN